MLLMLAVVLIGHAILDQLAIAWDDLHYGRPRTFQIDAYVGHEPGTEPSHFIVLNLHGHVEIIELAGGDPAHTRIYAGPQLYGPGADLIPVTIAFSDPAHTHHPDLVLVFQQTHIIFYNRHGTFQSNAP
jgi:hypothetical protein